MKYRDTQTLKRDRDGKFKACLEKTVRGQHSGATDGDEEEKNTAFNRLSKSCISRAATMLAPTLEKTVY